MKDFGALLWVFAIVSLLTLHVFLLVNFSSARAETRSRYRRIVPHDSPRTLVEVLQGSSAPRRYYTNLSRRSSSPRGYFALDLSQYRSTIDDSRILFSSVVVGTARELSLRRCETMRT